MKVSLLYSVVLAIIAIFFALAAAPARADDPAGQLCSMTGCPGIDFGKPRDPPKFEPGFEERRCPECEADALRRLNESIQSMDHPKPVAPLAEDVRSILNEDVISANASFALTMAGLGRVILVPPQVRGALFAAAALTALNAVLRPHLTELVDKTIVPAWLRMISFARSVSGASRSCEELSVDALAACGNASTGGCNESDDCETLLAKRAPLLACDRSSLNLRDRSECPSLPEADRQKMDRNVEAVKTCGRMISNDSRCCPRSVKELKEAACKNRRGSPTCVEESEIPLHVLLSSPKVLAESCRSALDKKSAAEACAAARESEGTQCYKGHLDAGHEKAVKLVRDVAAGCSSFLDDLRGAGLCL